MIAGPPPARTWVRVLYIPAHGVPEFRDVGNDLYSLAGLTSEGYLQALKITRDLILFCDAALPGIGTSYNFSVHGHFVHGDAFFARREGTGVVPLTDDDVSTILDLVP
ncbi:MAG TPA: hypothetical protein VME66_08380 [Candidatus Acidoferrales bacterium]|nr:hypothetical protein [Candidatus Acidoferrales bacterium]